MLRLLQWLISGCFHEWEVIADARFEYENDFSSGTCTKYTLRCKKCGSLKTYAAK